MTKKNLVNVVIPIYKENVTDRERNSLMQCVKILSQHPITLICPKGLNLNLYFSKYQNFKVAYFDVAYFQGLKGYNKLLLSQKFYECFKSFNYILIYQLDAWVFRDDLSYWCSLGYDYIGAPWIDTNVFNWLKLDLYPRYLYYIHKLLGRGRFLTRVGNGGFSLRKVNTFITNLCLFRKAAICWRANEDSFFSHYVKTFNPFFRIAPYNKALSFSFDIFPQKAYVLNNKVLPFGCHAWDKNSDPYIGNMNFWEKIIKDDFLPEDYNCNTKL